MKRIFNFKIMIIVFLSILFIEILMPLNALAIENQYIEKEQFDADFRNWENAKIANRTVGGMITTSLGMVLNILRIITLGWAIIMAVAIAVKYMTGSSQAKSQLKSDMPTYVIGAVLLFGASGIMTILKYFVEDVIG